MSTNTPRTTTLANCLSQSLEQSVRSYPIEWEELSAQLETELSIANSRIAELEQAITGRTVSCAACNETSAERDRWRECAERFKQAHDEMRDCILNERGNLEGERIPVNLILGEIDCDFDAALAEYTRCAESIAKAPPLDPLTSAIERMQQVPARELTDMLMDAPNYKSGAEYIRARLIEAAKG